MTSTKNFALTSEARSAMHKKQVVQNATEKSQRSEGQKRYGYPTQQNVSSSHEKALGNVLKGKNIEGKKTK